MIETRQQHAWKARAERERALLKAYSFKWYKDGDSWLLFAPGGEETTKQVALQEIRELQKSKPWHEVVRWARDLKNAVFLDSETTGFGKEDVIIDIAVTDKMARFWLTRSFILSENYPQGCAGCSPHR